MNSSSDLTQSASHYIGRLFEDMPAKVLLIAFGPLWTTIPAVYLYAIGWMLLDLASGIAKAYKIGPNRSKAGKDAALKFVIYLSMVALADYASYSWGMVADAIVPIPVIGEFLGGVLLLLARGIPYIASGLITHTELVSILENLQAIAAHQGKQYRALDLFARIVRVRGEEFIRKVQDETGATPPDTTKEETHVPH
ncbi:hypothetical protein D3C86_1266330 [compost metagenome]